MSTQAVDRSELKLEIERIEDEIADRKKELAQLRRTLPAEPIDDHELTGRGGAKVRLSEMFGDHDELFVIHNMGRSCNYCTLWADGFNSLVPHITNRAAFVLTSPDAHDVQADFADSRGWRFTMASTDGTTFIDDMGYREEERGLMPGVSVLRRTADGSIERVSNSWFGPGDAYCVAWDLFDLLPDGVGEWRPKPIY